MVRTGCRPRCRLDPDSRRAAILEVVVAMLAAHPYVEVTIFSIAVEAYSSDAPAYRYFADKEGPYTKVVRVTIAGLLIRQAEVLGTLPDGVPMCDRIRAATVAHLGHIAMHLDAWAMPAYRLEGEPAVITGLRVRTRCDYMERLRDSLVPSTQACHDYVLWGYFGFIDTVALRRAGRGYLGEDRWAFIDAALDVLEGALGD